MESEDRQRTEDLDAVQALLGRAPQGDFEVVVRHRDGTPVVIENAPLLDDGTPMPTRWWLVGEPERTWVGRLEAEQGVTRSEAAVDPARLADAHALYGAIRDAEIPADHVGPRPSGGVGGTRRGVKCLHAHFAWWLAGGDDPVGAWVADRLAEAGHGVNVATTSSGPVAAIDCGTNSTRLLIAQRGADGSLETRERIMHITRLGQGVDATGRLDHQAIRRTLDVLAEYRVQMDAHDVVACRATATSAARDATNRDDFFDPGAEILGVDLELLSGEQEAAFSFAGATAELRDRPGAYLVVDLGGGSTEIAAGRIDATGRATLSGAESSNIGCVRITERFLRSDPPLPTELAAAGDYCDEVVAGVMDRVNGARDAAELIGLAGTVSTMASIDLGLVDYDRSRVHHHRMDVERLNELASMLLAMPAAERVNVPGMESARAEVIAGGLVVLLAVLRQTGCDHLIVSEADILDGLAASLLEGNHRVVSVDPG